MRTLKKLEPSSEYENIHVMKIAEDSLQSVFVIWVKEAVKNHFHAEHSENIIVISGKATMTVDGKEIIIKKGDYLNIPKGTHHSVDEILSGKPLKVLSIQSPLFDGKDRVFVE
jgi:mannose-6-phosphate isomerase-like protein (cupin superfamily)